MGKRIIWLIWGVFLMAGFWTGNLLAAAPSAAAPVTLGVQSDWGYSGKLPLRASTGGFER